MPATISGLNLSRTGARTLSIAEGWAQDTTGTTTITIPAGQTRTVDLNGSGPGGLDTGSVQANRNYAVFVCVGSGGTVSGIASLSATEPSVGAGTKFRRVGTIATDASANVVAFTQSGANETRTTSWSTGIQVLSGGTATNTTSFQLAPASPSWASNCSLSVSMGNNVGATVANGNGNDSSHLNPPAASKILTPQNNPNGQYRNDGPNGSTSIQVVSFQETV